MGIRYNITIKKYLFGVLTLNTLATVLLLTPYLPKKLNPERYQENWTKLESCLDIKIDKKEYPDYYSVNNKIFDLLKLDGYYIFNNIYLKEQHINGNYPVRHEQLHAIGVGNEDLVEKLLERCK